MNLFSSPVSMVVFSSMWLLAGGFGTLMTGTKRQGKLFAAFAVPAALLAVAAAFSPRYPFLRLGSLELGIDPVSHFFMMIVAPGILFGSLYAAGAFRRFYPGRPGYEAPHLFFFSIFCASLLWVPMISLDGSLRQSLAFMGVWEIMSLSSFLLIALNNPELQEERVAVRYLTAMHFSAIFLLVGFISIAFQFKLLGLWCLFLGFGCKLGLFPFHFWMADTYQSAPGHVSGVLSGVMISLGVYGLVKTFASEMEYATLFGVVLLTIGMLTAIYGALQALAQHEAKKVLAYSSMENMGLIAVGLGTTLLWQMTQARQVYEIGFAAVFLLCFNHALFKPMLFYLLGAIQAQTRTLDLNLLGGLGKELPFLNKIGLTGSLGISMLPPLNGFAGKFLLYYGLLELLLHASAPGMVIFLGILLMLLGLVGALGLFTFVKFYAMLFQGAKRQVVLSRRNSRVVNIVLGTMAGCCLVLGIMPLLFGFVLTELRDIFQSLTILSMAIILMALLLYFLRKMLLRKHQVVRNETWGCGYDRISSRMEYTADSFTLPLVRLLDKLLPRIENNAPMDGVYPHVHDRSFEQQEPVGNLIRSLGRNCIQLLGRLEWIQSGRMQNYLWSGVLFLFLALLYVLFG